jgi:hypothetical protein
MSQNSTKSRLLKIFLILFFELEHCKLYFLGGKVCICGLVEVISPQISKKIGSANHKVPHLRKVRKSNTLFKSANLRICNLLNLFADRPLVIT